MSTAAEADHMSEWVKGDLPDQPAPAEKSPVEPAPVAAEPDGRITPASGEPEPMEKSAVEPQPVQLPAEPPAELPVEPQPEPEAPLPQPQAELLTLEAQIEALLFVADSAVPVARLAEALEVKPREVETALQVLEAGYQTRGIRLQRFRDKVQLTTAPAAADKVQHFLGLAASAPLSRAALETLAIIAYQQPVTRPQIEAVRGVNSDSVIKNLLSKGLIEETGRTEGPGRPVLYVVTPEMLQFFGLTALADLPPLNLDNPPAPGPEILKG